MQGWWRLGLGLAVTVAAMVGVAAAWPDGAGSGPLGSEPRTPTTLGAVFPPDPGGPDSGPIGPAPGPAPHVDLFAAGAGEALAAVLGAAGGPDRLTEVVVYPTYLVAAYVDPARPDQIDRRIWRAGAVGAAQPNPIDDRVDARTQPALFASEPGLLDRVPALVADAAGRYGVPVEVTHIIVGRFLPFDERVLLRVYARPSDGRSGGGYVSYLPDGTHLRTCC